MARILLDMRLSESDGSAVISVGTKDGVRMPGVPLQEIHRALETLEHVTIYDVSGLLEGQKVGGKDLQSFGLTPGAAEAALAVSLCAEAGKQRILTAQTREALGAIWRTQRRSVEG